MVGIPIPGPLKNLVDIAANVPNVLKTVTNMAKVGDDGTIGIVTEVVKAASAKDVEKIKQQQREALTASNELLARGRTRIENDTTLSDAKRIKKLARVDEMLLENSTVNPDEILSETMAAIVDANKKQLEPTILASLAPFTAMMGIPIFLTQLMTYLKPSSAGGTSPGDGRSGGGGGGGNGDNDDGYGDGNILE